MNAGSGIIHALKGIFRDAIFDIVRFPVWWYTSGMIRTWSIFISSLRDANESLGATLWAKNILQPMFAQYDLSGRIISFFMRLFQIIIRFLALAVWGVILFSLVIIWALLPPFVLSQIIYQMRMLLF